jgi:16S rRNA (cytosine967-C5)-methyltransferase
LSAVTDDGRTLDEALAAVPSYSELEGRDRAFARAIASAALRRLGGVDRVLAAFITRPLPDQSRMDPSRPGKKVPFRRRRGRRG